MHHRVVSLKEALKLLKGFSAYHAQLRQEYKSPNAFGSLNACFEEWEQTGNFDEMLDVFLEETESVDSRFICLAMLGYYPE